MGRLALAALLAACPQAASAHLVGTEFGGFYAGALHLLSDPAQLAALVALGIVAARQPREDARWSLAALPLATLAGALATASGLPAPPLDPGVALVLLVAGLAAVLALRLPAPAIAALAGAMGLVVGALNGEPAAAGGMPLGLYVAGVATAATVLGTLVVAALSVLAEAHPLARLGGRVLGSWLTAIGAVSMVVALAG